jgi:hypothetical protein
MKKIFIIIIIAVLLITFSIISYWLSTRNESTSIPVIEDEDIQISEIDILDAETGLKEEQLFDLNIFSHIDLSTPTYSLLVNEDLVFIGRNYEVDIISVADKKNPQKISSIKDPLWGKEFGWAIEMAINNQLYIGENHKLSIVNIDDLYDLVFMSSVDIDGFDLKIIPEEKFLYIAASIPAVEKSENTNLYVIDISDPYNPKVVVKINIKDSFYCMDKSDDLIYLAGSGKIVIIDISDLKNPFILKEIKIDGWGNDIYIDNDTIYMAGSEGFTIIDISRADYPVVIKKLDLGGYGQKISLLDDNAYILSNRENSNGNLLIVNIDDLENPEIILDSSINGIPRQIFVDREYIYITCADIYEYYDNQEADFIAGRFYLIENQFSSSK